MEIERKFLIKRIPDLSGFEKLEIEQGYISRSPVIRIRKSNSNYYLTIKTKPENLDKSYVPIVSDEYEIKISADDYHRLLKKVDDNIISKTRYLIPLSNGLLAELDIFNKQLSGLSFVEVEFPTVEMANNFKLPDWFGEDVSSDKRYRNSELSKVTSASLMNNFFK